MPRDQVFISYSHKDKRWLERLQTMLKPLVRNRKISVWDDTAIPVGGNWKEQIDGALAMAKVAVLLVSPHFLESDFIAKSELPPILNAAAQNGLVIFWIYVSSCVYQATEIKDYQAAHDISKPLDSLTAAKRNAVLVEVCIKIEAVANTSKETSPEDSLKDAVPQSAPPVGHATGAEHQVTQQIDRGLEKDSKETRLYNLYNLALSFRRRLLEQELTKLDSELLNKPRKMPELEKIIGEIRSDFTSLSADAQVRGIAERAMVIQSFDFSSRQVVIKVYEGWLQLCAELIINLEAGAPAAESISKTLHNMEPIIQFFIKRSLEELNKISQ